MNKIRNILLKNKVILFIVVSFLLTNLTGCIKKNNIVEINGILFNFTTGIEEDYVMKSQKCLLTEGQVSFIYQVIKNNYTELFTDAIWDYSVDDITFEDYVADYTKSMLVKLLIVDMLAEEKGIMLNAEEQKAADDKARNFIDNSNQEFEYAKEEEIIDMFRLLALSDKVYEEITSDIDTEISIDEARIINIQYIYSKDSIKNIENAIEALEAGEEFALVAKRYSDSSEYETEIGRGELDKEFEEVAFNLNTNEVSSLVVCTNGYYVIKCINDFVDGKVEAQKITILERRKKEQFENVFSAFSNNVEIYFDSECWEKVLNAVQ